MASCTSTCTRESDSWKNETDTTNFDCWPLRECLKSSMSDGEKNFSVLFRDPCPLPSKRSSKCWLNISLWKNNYPFRIGFEQSRECRYTVTNLLTNFVQCRYYTCVLFYGWDVLELPCALIREVSHYGAPPPIRTLSVLIPVIIHLLYTFPKDFTSFPGAFFFSNFSLTSSILISL